jgi:glutamate dehydrogenase
VLDVLPRVLDPEVAAAVETRLTELVGRGMAAEPARRLASLQALVSAPDIVRIAETDGHSLPEIAATHFAIAQAFRLDDLVAASRGAPVGDTFDRVALERAVAGISMAHRGLTAEVVSGGGAGAEAVEAWSRARGPALARIRSAVEAIASSGLTVSKAVVASSLLGDLARRP